MVSVLTIVFMLICPLIIFIILVQDPKGGGLAGVFGGAGGSAAFGAKTADVVMKATVSLGIVFFVLALVLGISLKQTSTGPETTLVPETTLAPELPAPDADAPAVGVVPAAAPAAPAPADPAPEAAE